MSHANKVENPTIADLLSAVVTHGSTTLDLNGRGLSAFPDDFPVCPKLECLYLEGNSLTTVPCNLAMLCPSLVWLDLRNNAISVIPPEISKIRNLKTLLLEGNKLQELPLELGLLHRLSGLSLSGNPLQSPPTDILQQGTKAVLRYLREQRVGGATEGEGDGEIISGEDSSDEEEGQVGVASDQGREGQRTLYKRNSIPRDGGRGLSSHRATLYSNLDLQKKRQVHIANLLSSMDKLRRTASAKSGKRPTKKPRPLPDQAEIGKIADKIERQKSKQCLDDWREETRRRQGGIENSSHVITRPPFATMATNEDPSNRIINVPQTTQETQQDSDSGEGGGVLTGWTKEFARQLQYTREVTMGTSNENITDDLLSAEQKLAKALAGRKTFESNANRRQYRLKAFTGDTLF